MSATLVIMAAGLASRYGGAKQIEKVGPGGEILMEYTIHDAQRAGFDRFVIILQPQMLEDFRAVCGERLEGKARVDYAFQSFDAMPDWFTVPEGRTKPYGTVPAVLSGKDVITGKFAVVNADDYYGPGAFTLMYEALEKLPETGRGCMVAYKLRNTVSDFGTVTRGVCRIDGGEMTAVEETFKIGKAPDGSIRSFADSEQGVALGGESPVSMNFWGFTPWALGEMETYFHTFLRSEAGRELKSECLLPTMMDELTAAGEISISVLNTNDRWFGLTYQEDKPGAVEALTKLHESGVYPPTLWNN